MPGNGTFVIPDYPIVVKYEDIVLILLLLVCISFFASIFPALKARESVKNIG
jgi:ABC-type lipoprotein release transport system permease subunit